MQPDEEQEALREYRIQQRVQQMQTQDLARTIQEDAGVRARTNLRWSLVFAILGALGGIIVAIVTVASALQKPDVSPLQLIGGGFIGAIILGVLFGYMFWGTYWGWIATWRWLTRAQANTGCIIWLSVLFIYLLFVIAFYYGILGGGIYQFLKARRVLQKGYAAANDRTSGESSMPPSSAG